MPTVGAARRGAPKPDVEARRSISLHRWSNSGPSGHSIWKIERLLLFEKIRQWHGSVQLKDRHNSAIHLYSQRIWYASESR